jgi:hypothetical protein
MLNLDVCYGSTRTVLLIGKYAVKIPAMVSWKHFLNGLLGNIQESEFNTLNHPKLCPVLFALPLGFLIVMPRCENVSREVFYSLDFKRFVKERNLLLPVEDKLSSFGMLNGKVVAVDYG